MDHQSSLLPLTDTNGPPAPVPCVQVYAPQKHDGQGIPTDVAASGGSPRLRQVFGYQAGKSALRKAQVNLLVANGYTVVVTDRDGATIYRADGSVERLADARDVRLVVEVVQEPSPKEMTLLQRADKPEERSEEAPDNKVLSWSRTHKRQIRNPPR